MKKIDNAKDAEYLKYEKDTKKKFKTKYGRNSRISW